MKRITQGILVAMIFSLAAAPRHMNGETFICKGGTDSVQIHRVDGLDAVVINIRGKNHLLERTVSASGTKYTDGEISFWSKGSEAFVYSNGDVLHGDCKLDMTEMAVGREIIELLRLPVRSYESMEVEGFDPEGQLEKGNSDSWALEPLRLALGYLGGIGGRIVTVTIKGIGAEGSDRVTVTIIQENLPDDSVRARWHRLQMARKPDGSWKLESANSAYRCYRGGAKEWFSASFCP